MKPLAVMGGALCLLVLTMTGCVHSGAVKAEGPDEISGVRVDPATLSPAIRMNNAFLTYGFELAGGYGEMISPQDALRLSIIAKQRAIALLCEGFEVDEARYNAAMDPVITPLIKSFQPQADGNTPVVNLPFTIGMSAYSVFLGGHLAVGAYDLPALCSEGELLRTEWIEDGHEDMVIWK